LDGHRNQTGIGDAVESPFVDTEVVLVRLQPCGALTI
jgi:hypothetical protein